MTALLTAPTHLFVVRDLQTDDTGTTVLCANGAQGRWSADNKDYAYGLRHLQRSKERQHPVGLVFGADAMLADVLRADNDIVAQLVDEPDRLMVGFYGHDGLFFLENGHPERARLLGTLRQSLRDQSRVWFLARMEDLTLLDVVLHVTAPAPANTGGIEGRFQQLLTTCRVALGPSASMADVRLHPAYQEIISLGPPVVPLLLREIEREREPWFAALKEITGADPVAPEDRGQGDRVAQSWVRWGKEQGMTW